VRKRFWRTDWFAGLAVAVLFLFASGSQWLQGLERSAYDLGVRATSRVPSEQVAVIAIDDESIGNIGRWPWPRDIHARMLDILRKGRAKVVGHTAFFLEPQIDPGLAYILDLADFYEASTLTQRAPTDLRRLERELRRAAARTRTARSSADADQAKQIYQLFARSSLAGPLGRDIATLRKKLGLAAASLDTDRIFAKSVRTAGNTVLAMTFVPGLPQGNPDQPLPEYVLRNALLNVEDRVGAVGRHQFPLTTVAAIPPIPELGEPSAAIGHLYYNLDVDGGVRTEPLVLLHYDTYVPSLALQLAAKSLNLTPDDVHVYLGEGVQLGGLRIATDGRLQMHTFFYGDQEGRPPFAVDSFFDVLNGRIPADKYRDKIVLIGATAEGVGAPRVTPVSPAMAPVLILAHSVSSILNEDFFVVPEWATMVEWGVFLLIALYLILLLPRLKAGLAAAITATLLVGLVVAHMLLMTQHGIWLQLMLSASLLLAGHLVLTTKRFLVTERGKLKSDAESAESNKMLGLAFQGQGQLDMAFEKFRKCPLDDPMLDLLYNLGLDFERKRQFSKAAAVYHYMTKRDRQYRDIEERMNRARAAEETVIFGGPGGPGASTLVVAGEGVQKPMLGRYQVEKELGKGAMGVVYLGRDPKINRVVAIKTMALSQEFDEDELEDVKERFFREAETAGRLTHPNIVTIFDAGEEHDLAYIAMEYLQGEDLVPHCKPDNLLPVPKVFEIVAHAADALDYAHAQNVVHRDIKPANLMYEPETGQLKITDFGIARITDSSRTKTGMVLGTPSYMSPEQLSGSKVDGRSDLFSLGVMLFQMITGSLPFQGDSMATLMFKIANEPHPDITALRPELPICLKSIVDKALDKDLSKRYQRGRHIAKDLETCLGQL
jgi:CHASE2 domain-containing sensor protein